MSTTYTISAIVMTDSRPALHWTGETFRDESWEPEQFDCEDCARGEFAAMDARFLLRHGFRAGAMLRIERANDDGTIETIAEKLVELVRCECGEWSGVPCEWVGAPDQTVTVELMPEHLRESHEAAGNHGVYPHNGAIHIQVEQSCADRILESEGDWAAVVD